MLPPTVETVADYDVIDEEAEELEGNENGGRAAGATPLTQPS